MSYLVFFLCNVLEIEIYKSIYYKHKTLLEINVLKNVYIIFTSLVPIIINNMYLLLCILWEEIMIKCLISDGKRLYRRILIVAIFYNIAALGLCVKDCVFDTNPEYK